MRNPFRSRRGGAGGPTPPQPPTPGPIGAGDSATRGADDATKVFATPGPPGPPGAGPVAPIAVAAAQAKRKRRKRRLLRAALALVAIVGLGFGILLIAYARTTIPPANASALQQTSQVYYMTGTGNKQATEIGRFGDTDREIVPLASMPQPLRDAVVAAENRTFYTDSGISIKGILRAVWVNLRGGSVQGGSTITQQYVKNYYLTSQRTLTRKITEALLSIKIDRKLSKDQILENYLNTIYLGHGAYGVQAAAKSYFNEDASKLTVAQGAVLASVIRSPALYDPSTKKGLTTLQSRWAYVLDGMVTDGKLSAADRAAQVFPAIPGKGKNSTRYGGQKGYILGAVENELEARGLTEDKIENGGLRIFTTLDPQAQAAAEAAVPKDFPKTHNAGVRVGLTAVQPDTGRILAMYGGKDFLGTDKYAQVNSATDPVEPGSGMKPFALAAALENGYGLNSVFDGNSPLALPRGESIRNEFGESYGASVTLFQGLTQSINTVFVDLAVHLGPPKIRDALVRAGIPNDTPALVDVPDIPLGTFSVPPTVVAAAYATLCGSGVHAAPHIVENVLNPDGSTETLAKTDVTPSPVFSSSVRSDVLRAMINVVQNGTGTAAKALGRPVAGKTGTHQSLTAWFNGCTPQMAASVDYYKGDATESLDGVGGLPTFFGAVYPAETWTTFMTAALKGKPTVNFNIGKGVTGTLDLAPSPNPSATPTGGASPGPSGNPIPVPTLSGGPIPTPTVIVPPVITPTPIETGPHETPTPIESTRPGRTPRPTG